MNMLKNISGMFLVAAVLALFGCGGGGGASQPTTATLKLLSQGTAGTKIRGIEVTVVLPQGVSVNANASAVNPAVLETNVGVVVLSGATVVDPAAFGQLKPVGIYTPATATTPGKVALTLPAQADFNLGEYVTVNAVIAAGSIPTAANFSLTGFTAVDLNGAAISGVTSSIVPDIR
jgi:hypothetical protein